MLFPPQLNNGFKKSNCNATRGWAYQVDFFK
jgi:hypothetical protein